MELDSSPTSFARDFCIHVTMHGCDWPELFGMARTKDSAQRYQTILSAAILLAEVVGWDETRTFLPLAPPAFTRNGLAGQTSETRKRNVVY